MSTESRLQASPRSKPTHEMKRVHREVEALLPVGFESRLSDLGVHVGTQSPHDHGHWYGVLIEEADPVDVAAAAAKVRKRFETRDRM